MTRSIDPTRITTDYSQQSKTTGQGGLGVGCRWDRPRRLIKGETELVCANTGNCVQISYVRGCPQKKKINK